MMRTSFEALARRAWAAGIAVFSVPLVVGLAYLAIHGAPQPIVHDEFSYLLAADTFAHGRLSNPEPAYWKQFQSVNELTHPSYMSKYPPGQGLFLGLGQALTGQPLIGAIFCVALAAAAVYWMLLAFVGPEWALFGGLLYGSHPLLILWLTNYWGGGVALLGGALVLGAWRRALDAPNWKVGALLGTGLALLANSRPFEGLLFSLPLILVLLWKRRPGWRTVLACAAAVMAPAVLWMALYNTRVTGNMWKLPYLLYEQTYNPAPLFIWKHGLRQVPESGVPAISGLWQEWNLGQYEKQQTLRGFLSVLRGKLSDFDEAWLEPLPIKFFLALPFFGLCGQTLMWLGLELAVLLGFLFTELFYFPHYTAPLGAVLFLLVVAGMRHAWDWRWRGRPMGRLAVIVTVMWCLGRSVFFLGRKSESPRTAWSYRRLEARERLLAMGGKHLVLVSYGPTASYHDDWVSNEADIDASPIVWAWSLGPKDDAALEEHYPGRAVWILAVVPPTPVLELLRRADAR